MGGLPGEHELFDYLVFEKLEAERKAKEAADDDAEDADDNDPLDDDSDPTPNS